VNHHRNHLVIPGEGNFVTPAELVNQVNKFCAGGIQLYNFPCVHLSATPLLAESTVAALVEGRTQ
jgi:hypothetical protein